MPSPTNTMAGLAEILGGELRGDGQVLVNEVVNDSRNSTAGCLFAAVKGFQKDGHEFASEAVSQGAAGLLVEEFVDIRLPQIKVADTRRALAQAAAQVHGHPSHQMNVIGVTGTNGKTTVTFMLEAIAQSAGIRFGRVGTLGVSMPSGSQPLARTTPEASDLQRLLAHMVEEKVKMAAIEVTSHALALHRVDEISWAVVAFTNLTQDHLDFHGDFENYFRTKQRLFDGRAKEHVIWTEDPAGARLAAISPVPVTSVGFTGSHDVAAHNVQVGWSGSRFMLRIGKESVEAVAKPGGLHNVANSLVAAACAHRVGVDLADIAAGLSAGPVIPGRWESVEQGQPFAVLVDYAHTPDAIEKAVQTARQGLSGRLIVVVGAAGDRDRTKRPLIGRAAARADTAIITSDNPRSEAPELLVKQVAEGAREEAAAKVVCQVDRAQAIHTALDHAQAGDVVLILGKGHETYQDIGGKNIPFSDRRVAADYLKAMNRTRTAGPMHKEAAGQ